ncbi:Transposon Tf2-12 polyprotein [Mycena venus]|uniref:Transposon Tf2-12 polyprotein n=1 Tax=Mycena venus TaxID=2733690 RepID=A0A8H6Z6K0_9AGAR|nr:Transposon Tf2-12 polyprotein [Mycena venus]
MQLGANPAPSSIGVATAAVTGVQGAAGTLYESFHDNKAHVIRTIIEREVGVTLQLPPHIRSPKVDPPAKYRGEDDTDVFMTFIEMLCTWLRAQMLCGHEPGVDEYRLTMLKTQLTGFTLEWFIQNVNSSHFADRTVLTFTDAVCALHRWFVTSANAQRAARAFDSVRYDDSKGPDAFAELLIKRANQMNHVPDEFAMNRMFLAGLPQSIRYKLKVDRQMTAEYTSFSVIRTDARQLWAAESEEKAVPSSTRSSSSTLERPLRLLQRLGNLTTPRTLPLAPTTFKPIQIPLLFRIFQIPYETVKVQVFKYQNQGRTTEFEIRIERHDELVTHVTLVTTPNL